VVGTIEDFADMKDSRSGLLPDHTVINYNTSSISLAACEASAYMRITLGEHYRQMGPNTLFASLKLNYAAGSPECARYRARIDLRRRCVARRSHPRR